MEHLDQLFQEGEEISDQSDDEASVERGQGPTAFKDDLFSDIGSFCAKSFDSFNIILH